MVFHQSSSALLVSPHPYDFKDIYKSFNISSIMIPEISFFLRESMQIAMDTTESFPGSILLPSLLDKPWPAPYTRSICESRSHLRFNSRLTLGWHWNYAGPITLRGRTYIYFLTNTDVWLFIAVLQIPPKFAGWNNNHLFCSWTCNLGRARWGWLISVLGSWRRDGGKLFNFCLLDTIWVILN